jgi:hypothetical protein
VQTLIRFGVPSTTVRTDWMFGYQQRRVRRCEWEIELPKPGRLPQMSQVAATGDSLEDKNGKGNRNRLPGRNSTPKSMIDCAEVVRLAGVLQQSLNT